MQGCAHLHLELFVRTTVKIGKESIQISFKLTYAQNSSVEFYYSVIVLKGTTSWEEMRK